MSKSVEDLIASYRSQSPTAFTALAIQTGEKDTHDYNKRKDRHMVHGGDPKCEYPCCSERGYCATPAQWAGCILCVVACCAFCCYVTNGFDGRWTYWPF